jgi:uncharacterized protein with HEPN domain
MLDAIERIQRHVGATTFDEFSVDSKMVAAVSYELLVLGEAAGHVADEIVNSHAEIPWKQIRGTRNALVHGYFQLGLPTLWETVQRDLPTLEKQLRAVLKG